MFDSKEFVLITILIVVGIAANFVLIRPSWGQPTAPPAEQEDASDENQDRPTAKDARPAPLPKPDESAKVEIFAIEYRPIEGVTGPKPLEPPARNKKFAFGGHPFFDDVNVYPHQKPLFVVSKEHVQSCKLKSRVHNPIDRTRRIVLEVGFTKEAQAELSRRIRALKPGKKTRWSVRLDGDKWWGEEPFPAGGVISGVDVCAALDRSEAERVKKSLLKTAKPLAHFRFNDRVRDTAGADSKVITQDVTVHKGAFISDGQIRIASETPFRIKTPSLNYRSFAVAVRFQLKNVEVGEQPVLTCGPETGWFRVRVKDGHLLVNLESGDRRYRSREMDAGPVEAGKWYDLVCFARRDEFESRVFLNGKAVQRCSTVPAGAFAPESLDAGSQRNMRIRPRSIAAESFNRILHNVSDSEKVWSFRDPRTGHTFHGQIDEFIVYERALSVAEAEGLRLGAAK
ncbi:hypothetical protein CKO51_24990 [Rhodopirellula sp. SM50]|nr:hypothetical protein [Rhodopirellula sp. SM50]PAY16800.1 hypothetical protein CKO51_24990 [Rhodopirellula sp. SM50]